jgi:uncharacterized protein (DUF2249 family)
MAKRVYEMLEEINNDITKIISYKDNASLKLVLQNNFDEKLKWNLPETNPPYKAAVEPQDMAPSNLTLEVRKFYIFRRQDLKPIKREQLFIQMLERLDKKEQAILLALKEQSLTNLYPNITKEAISTYINA